MKRLVPFLILAAFILGISGARVGRPHVKLKIRACIQSSPQSPIYLLSDDLSDQWDGSGKLSSSSSNFVFLNNPNWQNSPPCDVPRPTSPKHYSWLGLGCGGLPS
jgi:hypothetical protein